LYGIPLDESNLDSVTFHLMCQKKYVTIEFHETFRGAKFAKKFVYMIINA